MNQYFFFEKRAVTQAGMKLHEFCEKQKLIVVPSEPRYWGVS